MVRRIIILIMIASMILIIAFKKIREYRRYKDHYPIHGIIPMIFDLIGLIIIVLFIGISIKIMIATPISMIGASWGIWASKKENASELEILAGYLGIFLCVISLWPIVTILVISNHFHNLSDL